MTPQPNRPLTAEDVGLLKRGDVLRLETDYERGFPAHAGGITTVEDVDLEGDTITVRTHGGLLEYFYPRTMEEMFVFVERPAATPPSAGPDAGLIERLRSTRSSGIRMGKLWNPDGPAAIAALEAAEAQVAALREAFSAVANLICVPEDEWVDEHQNVADVAGGVINGTNTIDDLRRALAALPQGEG